MFDPDDDLEEEEEDAPGPEVNPPNIYIFFCDSIREQLCAPLGCNLMLHDTFFHVFLSVIGKMCYNRCVHTCINEKLSQQLTQIIFQQV
jgi:hypothetical protein